MSTLAQINQLRWRYSVGDWVLRDIDLELQPGERVGLVGRSGSGKSSLALTFNGIIPQSYAGRMAGGVVVGGMSAATTPVAELAHLVAMVFQSPDDQMSQILVRHEVASGPANLRLPLSEIHQRTSDALRLLGIEHLAERETATLSGGEKQKVALAAALAMRPRLLVLDEPTTDLDPRAKSELIDVLSHVDAETTMVVVSHDLETIASLVQRLLIVDDGCLVASADALELLSEPGVLADHGIAAPQLATVNAELRKLRPDWTPANTADELADGLQHHDLLPLIRTTVDSDAVPAQAGPIVIRISNLTFRYPGVARPAIDDVSLSICKGELVAVVGNNGSGKTTLSKLILGLLKSRNGRVEVLDRVVDRIRPELIGYIYQNPDAMLSQMTVRDEVAFTPRLLGQSDWQDLTTQMLGRFGLTQLATRFPLALSKGQRQRVAYAAVTASGPPILIFDEPTTGIDQPGCDQIMQYMDALRRDQRTIVFITHDMPLALRWADRIVVLHDGRLVHDGPPESVIKLDPGELARFHLKLPPVAELARRLHLGGRVATAAALLERLSRPQVEVTVQ